MLTEASFDSKINLFMCKHHLTVDHLRSAWTDRDLAHRVCITQYIILPEKFEPFNMSATPLDTKRSPGETSNPGKLTTTELRLLCCSLRTQ